MEKLKDKEVQERMETIDTSWVLKGKFIQISEKY